MRPNPFRDAVAVLSASGVTTIIFWLLLLGSCAERDRRVARRTLRSEQAVIWVSGCSA